MGVVVVSHKPVLGGAAALKPRGADEALALALAFAFAPTLALAFALATRR